MHLKCAALNPKHLRERPGAGRACKRAWCENEAGEAGGDGDDEAQEAGAAGSDGDDET